MTPPSLPRLRIAILNRGFLSRAGGAERYSVSLVEALAVRHEIHVFAQHIDHVYPGITYHHLKECVRRPSWINLLCYNIRTWWATRIGFDIVHSHENTWHGQIQTVHVRTVKVGLFYGRRGWARFIRYLQTATSPRLWTYLLMERFRFAKRSGRIVVATSQPLKAELEQAYPTLKGRVTVLPPGVHVPQKIDSLRKKQLREKAGIPADSFVLLFVGNDYGKKGLGPLLQALVTLPSHVQLLVVGNSKHIAEYAARAKKLGLESRLLFIGSVSNVELYYQMADALVHPTTEDTFALVVLEAMAYGLPVIVSGPKWCGISASLQHETEVLLLQNPYAAEEISDAVSRLVDDKTLCVHLAEQGRVFASKYGWESLASQQEQLYYDALAITAPSL